MVHHVALYKLRPDVTPEIIEEMIRKTRSLLLKIPEVLSVRSGKKIEAATDWPFFVSLDFESRHKQNMFRDDPVYLKFLEEVVRANTTESLLLDYETDPGRNVKYS
jgi:Stress responsive A/B Barrel Domain